MTTAKINTSLDKLLHDLDNLQIKRRPLQPHVTQPLSEPDKLLYATVLVTLLTNQDISEAQSRLLSMLLDSMAMTHDLQKLYANIPKLDIEQLKIFCELCDKHSLGASFLMDVLTLCRLDKALSEQQSKSLSELVSLLGLDETALLTILHLSNKVLGDTITPSAELSEAKIEELSGLSIDFDYESLRPWHEFGYQMMTKANLIKGITIGDWIILEEHSINKGIVIKNANILFAKNARITVKAYSDGNHILIKNANLINANFIAKKLNSIALEDSCLFNNGFIFSDISNINMSKCELFSNKNSSFNYNFTYEDCYRTFIYDSVFNFSDSKGLFFVNKGLYIDTDVNINNSKFLMSSDIKLTEFNHALYFKDGKKYNYNIKKCDFSAQNKQQCLIEDNCNLGRKIVTECNFNINEISVEVIKSKNNIIIRSDQTPSDFVVFRSCKFENVLSCFNISNARTLFYNSIFVNSTVYNNLTNNENKLFSKCNIKNKDIPIVKKFEYVDQ